MAVRRIMVAQARPKVADPDAYERDSLVPALWHRRDPSPRTPFSDGDATEERLLAHVLALDPSQDADLACEALVEDWPSQYHGDPARRNLLCPVAHLIRGRVLEIGAGCGALTGFLARRADELVALEGAPRRARITAARHRQWPNLTVLAAEFADFLPVCEFDAIVVVGVLEYAPLFTEGGLDAPLAFLRRLRSMLAQGGTLLVAIENQMGLSYLGGMPEDHAGRPWVGVEDRYGERGFRTFGRKALATLLSRAGLAAQSWYVPFPDYKLPQIVFAEAALRHEQLDAAELVAQVGRDRRYRPDGPGFAPALAWKVAGENRLLGELADSFLVAVGATETPPVGEGGLAWLFSTNRRPCFRKAARVVEREGALVVQRWSLAREAAAEHGTLRQVLADEPFHCGVHYMDALRRICATRTPDAKAIAAWASDWLGWLLENARPDTTLPADFLDAIPGNLVRLTGGGVAFFDREWIAAAPLALSCVAFRGLLDALLRMSDVLPQGSSGPFLLGLLGEVMAELGVPAEILTLSTEEARLQEAVTGADPKIWLSEMQARRFQASPCPMRAEEASGMPALTAAYNELRRSYQALAAHHLRGILGGGDGLIGYVDEVTKEPDGSRMLRGWAWNRALAAPADLVVLFIGGRPAGEAPVCLQRDDAAYSVGAGTQRLGFAIPLPDGCGAVTHDTATVMAWSAGSAGLLPWASGSA